MRALERLIIPSKAIGQHVVEQLELRGSNSVDVIVDPADADGDAAEEEIIMLSGSSDDDDEMGTTSDW